MPDGKAFEHAYFPHLQRLSLPDIADIGNFDASRFPNLKRLNLDELWLTADRDLTYHERVITGNITVLVRAVTGDRDAELVEDWNNVF